MAQRTRPQPGTKRRASRGSTVAAGTRRLLEHLGDAGVRLARDRVAASPVLPAALVVGIPIVHSTGVAWSALISETLGLAAWICSCGAPLAGVALLLALSRRLTQAAEAAPRSVPVVLARVAGDPEPARARRVSRRRPSPASTTADEVCGVHGGERLELAALVERCGLYDRFADAAA